MTKGTVEHFRHTYLNFGMKAMIHDLRKQFPQTSEPRFQKLIQAIMHGVDDCGHAKQYPQPPESKDITENYSRYQFMERVYGKWMNHRLNANRRKRYRNTDKVSENGLI